MVHFIFILLVSLAISAPWPIAGNWPFARTAFLVVSCLLLARALWQSCSKRGPQQRAGLPAMWILLLVGIGWTGFQASSLSVGVQASCGQPNAPVSVTVPAEPADVDLAPRPISVNPPATRAKLVDLIYGIGIFVSACMLLYDRKRVKVILGALAGVGVAISAVGIAQKLSGDTRILWSYELLWGGSPFATFVNGNNAAGFLIVCFSAGVFFVSEQWLSTEKKKPIRRRDSEGTRLALGGMDWEEPADDEHSFTRKFLKLIAGVQPAHLYCLSAMAVIMAGVFACGSRGGMLALTIGLLVAVLMISKVNRLAFCCTALVVMMGAAGIVFYSEQSTNVMDEIQSLSDLSDAAAPRLMHWQDAAPFAARNALLGCGSGTYRYVSPTFQSFVFGKVYGHAECVYLETLVEMGLGGLVLLALVIAICGWMSQTLFRSESRFDQSLGIAGFTCLTGQVAASALDFGIYQPANTTAMALLMGAVFARYTQLKTRSNGGGEDSGSGTGTPGSRVRRMVWLRPSFITLLLALSLWAVYESWGVELQRSANRSVKLFQKYGKDGPRATRKVSLSAVDDQLALAAWVRPDDVEVSFLRGELELLKYRQKEVRGLTDWIADQLRQLEDADISPQAKTTGRRQLERFGTAEIWNSTSAAMLHEQIRTAEAADNDLLDEVLSKPALVEHLSAAVAHFKEAERLCPRLSKTQLRLAQLVVLESQDPSIDTMVIEQAHLQAALRRSIPRTSLLFVGGLLSLNSKNYDLAADLWRQCLARSRSYQAVIVDYGLRKFPTKRFYEDVLPQDPARLLDICRRHVSPPRPLIHRKLLVMHIRQLIESQADLPKMQRIQWLAEAASLINDYTEVAKFYGRIESAGELPAASRLDYAFALYQTKQFEESLRQLKKCELDPDIKKSRVKSLLNRIRVERSQ